MQQCVVAVYPTRENAQRACDELQKLGVPQRNVRLSSQQESSSGSEAAYTTSGQSSFWDWLFGTDVPEDDRRLYHSRITQGQTALSVYIDGSPSIAPSTVERVLDRCGATDLHVEGGTASGPLDMPAQSLGQPEASGRRAGQKEEVIPLAEEELRVGKRATEQVHRIRTYVVEKPVQEDVTLHDERVTIERRPAQGTRGIGAPVEREYEIREHHEEPVVEKRTKAGEEVVIRREASDRTERVSDTVRKTKVDITKDTPRR